MSLQGTSREVLELAIRYKQAWRDEPESKWLMRVVEEVGELAEHLLDGHEHTADHELQQIASICLNWLDMRSVLEEEKQTINDRTDTTWRRTGDYTE